MQHAVLHDEGRVAAATLPSSLERWWHRYSVCVVVVEDWGHSEKLWSGCKNKYRSRHAEENWRAEEAFVSDCVTHERVLVDLADDHDCDSGKAEGLEAFQRRVATLHSVREYSMVS
jgi:hypothetical protein